MTDEVLLPPSFRTERLLLRPVRESDAPSYQHHFADYEVVRYLSAAVPWPYPSNGVHDYITNVLIPTRGKGKWDWGIFLKNNPDELIGGINLWREGKPENRGFWLGRPFWGNGYMTEAVEPVIDFAFDQAGFEKLILSNATGHSRSGRIKDKTGACFLHTKPYAFVDPEVTTLDVYELTHADWLAFKKSRTHDQ